MRDYSVTICLLIGMIFCPFLTYASPSGESILVDSVPAQWAYNEHFNQEIPTDDNWWASFNDPMLDSLISEGVANNFNVLMAGRRIEVAKQALNSVRAGYLPTVGFSGGWTKSRSSGATTANVIPATTVDYMSLGLNMSWEVDIFGKIASKAKQSKASYNATRAEYAAAMTSLCANIAKSYITLRMYQAEYAVATEHIASQGKIVKMTEARQAAGLASALDVAQAKIVYYSTQASLPGLESSIHTTINSLATLLGVYPDEIYKKLEIAKPLPEYQRIVPVGVPADLLRRRPDVVQAEYEVAGYAAAVGIAKKDFLPTLAINGTIGTTAHKGDELFKNQSLTYSIAPTLTWTLFDGLARRANLISAREQYQIGVENYNLTVMTAVQEVDNAYSSYLSSLKSIDVLNQLVDQSRKALALSVDLYKSDLKPFSDVVSAQMSLLENQNSLVTSQGQALTSLIALYEALGGGWNANQIN